MRQCCVRIMQGLCCQREQGEVAERGVCAACRWALLHWQVVLVGVLMLRPQLVSKPAALLYDAVKSIIDQGRAQAEVAKANRGVWRPA